MRPGLPRAVPTAWKDLRHRRGQSILTGVSLLVGILAVVAIYTASAIVRDVFVAEEERAHGRAVTVAGTAAFASAGDAARLAERLDARLGAAGAEHAVEATVPVDLLGEWGVVTTAQSVWVDGDLRAIRRLPLRAGRWTGTAPLPPEVVVNERLAEAESLAVGDPVRLGSALARSGLSVTVVGVVADGLDEQVLYGNLRTVLALAPELVTGSPLTVLAHLPGADAGRVGQAVALAVTQAGGTLSDAPRRVDRIAELEETLRRVQLAFLACALVALVVSALGILNIGLAGIRERSRELLLRRAVGARRSDLVALVLLGALYVAVAATVAGIGLAVVVVEVVVPATLREGTVLVAPHFPWQAAVAGTVAAVVTTLVGAAVPAVVAARVDIAGALRA